MNRWVRARNNVCKKEPWRVLHVLPVAAGFQTVRTHHITAAGGTITAAGGTSWYGSAHPTHHEPSITGMFRERLR